MKSNEKSELHYYACKECGHEYTAFFGYGIEGNCDCPDCGEKENDSTSHIILVENAESTAKDILKSKGYYADSLWCNNDVMHKFNATSEQAQYILDKALNNDATMEQIWFSINFFGEELELKKVNP